MTVVASVKVFDGMVLAADSATSLALAGGGFQVYNNADKIFHLHRDLPIGAATWGGAQIQSASISTLAKDLRRRLMGLAPLHRDWQLDPKEYTLQAVTERLLALMYDELYCNTPADQAQQPIGFLIAGYSAGERHPEAWEVTLSDPNQRPGATQVWNRDQFGWRVSGQGDAIARLFNGFSPTLQTSVMALVADDRRAELNELLMLEMRQPVVAAMPFADAIKLSRFFVDVTIGFTRFLPGPEIVGGPVDVAGISRHEGFKWVERKHYYPPELNPRRPHDHDQ